MSEFSHYPKIIPNKYTSTVVLKTIDFLRYKEKSYKKLDKFYIHKKRVQGEEVFLEIRSARINEFCDLLTNWNIDWKYYRFHTQYLKQ